MWDDPDAALARQQRREETRRRRRESQRDDLFHAARTLIPDHGIAIPLSRIAVHAGLPRHVAAGLFNGTADLATALVRRAWRALIETTAPPPGTTPQAFIAGLIGAIRSDAPTHRIHQALCCGAANWQRSALAEDEAFLAFALAEGLRETWPGRPMPDAPRLGRRLLALCRDAALTHPAADANAEAAIIAAMIAASLSRAVAPAAPEPDAAAPRQPRAAPASAPHHAITPQHKLPTAALLRQPAPVHDPPARAA